MMPEAKESGPNFIYPNIPQGFAIIAVMIVAMLLFSPVLLLSEAHPWQELLSLVYYILSMGSTLWFVRRLKMQLEGQASFAFRSVPLLAFPLFVLGAIGVEIIANPVVDLIPVPKNMEEWFVQSIQQRDVFTLLMMVVAAPVIEELLFRGVILDGFLRQFEPWQAILASSFLFGFAHLNPWQFVSGMAIGLFLGWAYYRTRSLAVCMVAHAATNLVGFAVRFYLKPEMALQSSAEFFGGPLNYAMAVGIALTVTAMSVWLLDRILRIEE